MAPASSEATLQMRGQASPTAASVSSRRARTRSKSTVGYQLFTIAREACTLDWNAESSIASSWRGATLRFRTTSSLVSPAVGARGINITTTVGHEAFDG